MNEVVHATADGCIGVNPLCPPLLSSSFVPPSCRAVPEKDGRDEREMRIKGRHSIERIGERATEKQRTKGETKGEKKEWETEAHSTLPR